jgi:glutaredoxin
MSGGGPCAVMNSPNNSNSAARAKGLLRDAAIDFDELVLNRDFSDRTLRAVSPEQSYPQIFVNGERIGGSDALADWLGHRRAA